MLRVRHCVECPKCRTRYLPGSNPYCNGSYLVPLTENLTAGWILFCSCGTAHVASRSNWSELKPYAVSAEAHRRGYGPPDEIRDVNRCSDDPRFPAMHHYDKEFVRKPGAQR
jgi:hypothetical protein